MIGITYTPQLLGSCSMSKLTPIFNSVVGWANMYTKATSGKGKLTSVQLKAAAKSFPVGGTTNSPNIRTGGSGDGTSKPPRRTTSRRATGKTDSKPTGKTFTGYRTLVAAHINKELGLSGSSSAQLKIKIGGEESGVSAFVKSKFNSGDVDILNKIVAKEIAHEVKKGSGDYTAVATKSKRRTATNLKDKGMSKRDMWSSIKNKSAAIKAQFGLGNTSPWRGTTVEMRKYYDWAMGGTTDPKPDPKPARRTGGKTDRQSTSSKIARPYGSKKIADSEMKKHKQDLDQEFGKEEV